MPKLASCPFCGCTTVRQFHPFEQRGYVIDCNQCNGGFHNIPEDQAVERWNTRKSDDGWRTMESAPKDGTWVLLTGGYIDYGWDGNSQPVVVSGQFIEMRWQFAWYDGGYYGEYEKPTAWRPLPSPPEG